MYDLLTKVSEIEKSIPYQPSYPLRYDSDFGPWSPITSKEESLRQDFKFLILTEPGEWPMNPDLGVGLRRYLFNNYNADLLRGVESRIRDQIQKYLPRVKLISAIFNSEPDQIDKGKISLTIKYTIMGNIQEVSRIHLGEKGYLIMEIQKSSHVGTSSDSVMPLASKVKVI